MTFIFVALGGAVGACGRYAISLIPVKSQFPILTLITNLLGALLIAAFAEALQPSQPSVWKPTTFCLPKITVYAAFMWL